MLLFFAHSNSSAFKLKSTFPLLVLKMDSSICCLDNFSFSLLVLVFILLQGCYVLHLVNKYLALWEDILHVMQILHSSSTPGFLQCFLLCTVARRTPISPYPPFVYFQHNRSFKNINKTGFSRWVRVKGL